MDTESRHVGFRGEAPHEVVWSELSYVVPVHPSERRDCRGLQKSIVIGSFGLFGLSILIFFFGKFIPDSWGLPEQSLTISAGICLFAGILLGVSNFYITKWMLMRRLRDRSELLFEPGRDSIFVQIEDAFSFDKLKMATEDYGLMQITPGLVQMEMAAHRAQFIAGQLTASFVYAHKNAVGVRLSFNDQRYPWSVVLSPAAAGVNFVGETDSKKRAQRLLNRLTEAGVLTGKLSEPVKAEPVQKTTALPEDNDIPYAGAVENEQDQSIENEDLIEHQYQAILQEIRGKERARKGWLKSLAILAITLLVFFQLGLMRWGPEAVAAILVVIAIHELGHLIGMKAFGYRNIQMFFVPLAGAAVAGTGRNVAAWKKALVTLMGPLPGLAIGVVLAVLALFGLWSGMVYLATVFLVLNLLNLLPIIPLDGGRFLNEVLFSRSRFLEAVMNVLAAAVLLVAGFALNDWILKILGFLNLVTIGHKFKLAAAAKKIRTELLKQNPALLEHGDDGEIPEHVLKQMIVWMRQNIPGTMSTKTIATMAVDLWDRIRILPPRAGASVGLLALYLGGYMVAFMGLFVVGANYWRQNLHRSEIVSIADPNTTAMYAEHRLINGGLDTATELSDDRRYYHGRHVRYKAGVAVEEGVWDNGRKVGTWQYREPNGIVYREVEYEDGRPVWMRTLEDGQWQETRWDALPEIWKEFYPDHSAEQQGPKDTKT